MPALLGFTASDHPFDIFNLFLLKFITDKKYIKRTLL
jgi:hypothetical protein